jgi:hypothetical protein
MSRASTHSSKNASLMNRLKSNCRVGFG